ncbi:7-carboxy-7-deazaguanine synthase [hydrothermal vent metagenome]|uniref:7-carboxy-7-deazaguanine synthase n=1 Tax=hydrothermal vent metagenome TaxID=652676 RepID=A0A3B0ZA30_9ZZZZ
MEPLRHISTRQLAERLRISEIFISLQGESTAVGLPTVFVRLTGCPLRCQYCDTEYAFRGGEFMATNDVVAQVARYQVQHVTVTGGEPMAQPACVPLLERLCDAGYKVSLETSGALDISQVDTRVMKVIDLKTPGSGEVDKNRFENLQYLAPRDQVKFVICDHEDYLWACRILEQYQIATRCEVLFSPSYDQQDASELAGWILADRLQVRFQIQLHKILWGNEPGR